MSAHAAADCSAACAAECAGVPSFPTFSQAGWRADVALYWLDPLSREAALALAEAWAWRVADTLPASAQSRRDALADAEWRF